MKPLHSRGLDNGRAPVAQLFTDRSDSDIFNKLHRTEAPRMRQRQMQFEGHFVLKCLHQHKRVWVAQSAKECKLPAANFSSGRELKIAQSLTQGLASVWLGSDARNFSHERTRLGFVDVGHSRSESGSWKGETPPQFAITDRQAKRRGVWPANQPVTSLWIASMKKPLCAGGSHMQSLS